MSTNSQPAVGIAGVQAAARSSGSTTRAGSKKFFLLAIKWAPLIGLLLALAFLWKDYASKTSSQKGDVPPATTSTQAVRQEAKWKRLADGSIPVGVWSETFAIDVGCKTSYDAGVGTDFNVRYRFYTNEWTGLKPGTYPPANEVQFILLKPRKEVLIRVTCS